MRETKSTQSCVVISMSMEAAVKLDEEGRERGVPAYLRLQGRYTYTPLSGGLSCDAPTSRKRIVKRETNRQIRD